MAQTNIQVNTKSKALFIGGTGTISSAIVKKLSQDSLWEVWLLNRGNRKNDVPAGVHQITCDISNEEEARKKRKQEKKDLEKLGQQGTKPDEKKD